MVQDVLLQDYVVSPESSVGGLIPKGLILILTVAYRQFSQKGRCCYYVLGPALSFRFSIGRIRFVWNIINFLLLIPFHSVFDLAPYTDAHYILLIRLFKSIPL